MTRTKILAVIAVLGLTMSGCGSGGSGAPSSSAPATSGTSTSSAVPTSVAPTSGVSTSAAPTSGVSTSVALTGAAPSVPFSSVPTSANPANPSSELLITDVRAGAHDGFDRVVIELTGGQPGQIVWKAEFVDNPHTQGKGDPIDLPGAATLSVSVFGLTYPPAGTSTPHGLQSNSAQGNITAVFVDPVFEGQAHVYIGLDAQRGFHIVEFDSPTRIVIDIRK